MSYKNKGGEIYRGVPESLLKERFGDIRVRDELGEKSLPGVWNVSRSRNKPPIKVYSEDSEGNIRSYTADAVLTGVRLQQEENKK